MDLVMSRQGMWSVFTDSRDGSQYLRGIDSFEHEIVPSVGKVTAWEIKHPLLYAMLRRSIAFGIRCFLGCAKLVCMYHDLNLASFVVRIGRIGAHVVDNTNRLYQGGMMQATIGGSLDIVVDEKASE